MSKDKKTTNDTAEATSSSTGTAEATTKEATSVATASPGAVTAAVAMQDMYSDDEGGGFEKADQTSFAIPFLYILQSGSPQVKKSDGAYIKSAEEGMLYNTVTGELYGGEEGVSLVPCAFLRTFTKWKPRDDGGGFLGELEPSDPILKKVVVDAQGRDTLPDGNQVVDTRKHYCLLLTPSGIPQMVVVALSSTQVKKSKTLMARMEAIKFRRPDGSVFTPPMFAHKWIATTVPESNDKGSWFGWKFEIDGMQEDVNVYKLAKEFKQRVMAGEVKEAPMPDTLQPGGSSSSSDDEKDVPF